MTVLVVGASENPERYSNRAMLLLKKYNHEVFAVGLKAGTVDGMVISKHFPAQSVSIDTVTLYVGPDRQNELFDSIINLRPRRVIFNPGTENPEFYKRLDVANITYEVACTLVLLSTNSF